MRKVGMLMPVASLPGRHGIGDFGKESYNFVDLLKEAKAAIRRNRSCVSREKNRSSSGLRISVITRKCMI